MLVVTGALLVIGQLLVGYYERTIRETELLVAEFSSGYPRDFRSAGRDHSHCHLVASIVARY